MNAFAVQLKERNLKVTPQRMAIYEELCATKAHPSAEDIHHALAGKFPTMSLATVYKTLDALCAAGLALELSVGSGSLRYEPNLSPHPHFVCRCCGNVIDLGVIADTQAARVHAEEDMGFKVQSEQVCFFGICDQCAEEGQWGV